MTNTTANGLRFPRFPSSKFSVPTVPTSLVQRPRLLETLDSGRHAPADASGRLAGSGQNRGIGQLGGGSPGTSTARVNCDVADAESSAFFGRHR